MASSLKERYSDVIVDRRGSTPNSFMKTDSICGEILPGSIYRIEKDRLIQLLRSPKLPQSKLFCSDAKIKTVTFIGDWIDSNEHKDDSNILGSIGQLKIDRPTLIIPEEITTEKTVAFYGAKLLTIGDNILFDTEVPLPVTKMQIGNEYINSYIMSETGANGVYLEYHDRPHFHMPLNENATGYIILGKNDNFTKLPHKENNSQKYMLTAFKIPYDKAIYTPPYVFHNDCFLVGDYCVVYSITPNYSTVRFVSSCGTVATIAVSPLSS
jgi:hypothetical protein